MVFQLFFFFFLFHSFHPWSYGGHKYLHSDLLGPPRSWEALHLDHLRIGSILITDDMGWALSQLLQIKLRMYTCTHSDFFFPPAELKLSCWNVFAVTFQQFGWEQTTYLHPESLSRHLCVRKKVFGFYGFLSSPAAPFPSFCQFRQRRFVNAWSFLTLKVAVTNFPFVLYLLQCYRFFLLLPRQLQKLHSPPRIHKLHRPRDYLELWRVFKTVPFYWKRRFGCKPGIAAKVCLRIPEPFGAGVYSVCRQMTRFVYGWLTLSGSRAPSNCLKPDTIWGEREKSEPDPGRPERVWVTDIHLIFAKVHHFMAILQRWVPNLQHVKQPPLLLEVVVTTQHVLNSKHVIVWVCAIQEIPFYIYSFLNAHYPFECLVQKVYKYIGIYIFSYHLQHAA